MSGGSSSTSAAASPVAIRRRVPSLDKHRDHATPGEPALPPGGAEAAVATCASAGGSFQRLETGHEVPAVDLEEEGYGVQASRRHRRAPGRGGVAPPEDVDALWGLFNAPGIAPFRLTDRVGLDVVLNIEEHYADVRPGIPEGPRKLLRRYIEHGRLGVKSGHGFYDYAS